MADPRDDPVDQLSRNRQQLLSEGHNPPKFVDRRLPTFDVGIYADGGPGKTVLRARGTNPWTLGSITIGSNKILCIDYMHFEAASPNMWFKLRHNHSGSAAIPGGTIDSYYLGARGGVTSIGGPDQPLLAVRGPGTLFLYAMGAGSVSGTSSNLVHKALGTRGVDRYAGKVRGWIV